MTRRVYDLQPAVARIDNAARQAEPHPGKIIDIVMLVMPGGQERTTAEYATLLEKAGFKLTRVVPTNSAVSVVEAKLA